MPLDTTHALKNERTMTSVNGVAFPNLTSLTYSRLCSSSHSPCRLSSSIVKVAPGGLKKLPYISNFHSILKTSSISIPSSSFSTSWLQEVKSDIAHLIESWERTSTQKVPRLQLAAREHGPTGTSNVPGSGTLITRLGSATRTNLGPDRSRPELARIFVNFACFQARL